MVTGTKGLELIKKFESCKLTAYKLAGEKNYTIGWGHSDSTIKAGDKITQAKADSLLKSDLAVFEKYVTQYAGSFNLTQNQFDALVSYCYNRGPAGLKQLISNSKTKFGIYTNIPIYWGTNETYKTGLINRRKCEQALFNTPASFAIENPYKTPSSKSIIKVGDKGESVSWVQWNLNIYGWACIKIDGNYGSITKAAVISYQKRKKLSADGVVGPNTIAAFKKDMGI